MSDTEETHQEETAQEESSASVDRPQEDDDAEAVSEAERVMEERRKEEKMDDDLAEYTVSRKEQKAAEEEEIRALKEKREQRLKERAAEEEKSLAEQRQQEHARRRAEEEERIRKIKLEDKRKDMKGWDGEKKFTINKREDRTLSEEEEDDNKPEQKSKEQLEAEKRAVLKQRIKPLSIDGADKAKLIQKARELHGHLLQLAGNQYDLEDSFKRQQYDIMELAERARAMSKTKSRRGESSVQIDESKYNRHTDYYDQQKKMYEDLSTPGPFPPPIQDGRHGQRMRPVPQENEDAEDNAE